jgi:hypothetical protein
MTRASLGLVLAFAAFTATSCGSSETEEDRVVAAIERMQGDMAAGKMRAVCAAMTRTPKRQIGSAGHGRKPTTCERDVRELVLNTEIASGSRREGLRRTPRPEVVSVDIGSGGMTAVATMTLGDDPFRIPLTKEDDKWKLDDFFGASAPAPKDLR